MMFCFRFLKWYCCTTVFLSLFLVPSPSFWPSMSRWNYVEVLQIFRRRWCCFVSLMKLSLQMLHWFAMPTSVYHGFSRCLLVYVYDLYQCLDGWIGIFCGTELSCWFCICKKTHTKWQITLFSLKFWMFIPPISVFCWWFHRCSIFPPRENDPKSDWLLPRVVFHLWEPTAGATQNLGLWVCLQPVGGDWCDWNITELLSHSVFRILESLTNLILFRGLAWNCQPTSTSPRQRPPSAQPRRCPF